MKNALILILSAMLSIACSNPPATNAVEVPSPSPAATQKASVAADAPTTDAPADEAASEGPADFEGTAGITESKKPDADGVIVMNAARSARHTNYDRIVFEFEGPRLPSYKIEYIDKPVRSCGSGDVVPFAGDAWLSVRFTGANAHTKAGEPTVRDRTRSPNLPIVKDMKLICDFEAEVEWVMGLALPNKYRVLELKNPTRLVVDVKHER